jgi:type II secretory pathway component PulL
MADTSICLDIHEESVVAVAVERTAKGGVSVTGCVRIQTGETEFAEAVEKIRLELGRTDAVCRVTLGAEMFSFRRLALPFTERRKIEQVLPMELADLTPTDIADVVIDYVMKSGPDGAEILAATTERKALADRLAAIEAAGMVPESIGISGLDTALALAEECGGDAVLLDIGSRRATLFLIRDGGPALIRSYAGQLEGDGQHPLGDKLVVWVRQTLLACRLVDLQQPDFAVFIAGADFPPDSPPPAIFGVEVRMLPHHVGPQVTIVPALSVSSRPDVDRALAVALRRGRKSKGFDFYKDEFKQTRSLADKRKLAWRAGLPLALCCLLAMGYFAYDYRRLTVRHDRLKSEIVEVFKETLPYVTKVVNPVRQLQVQVNEIKQVYRPGGSSVGRYTVIDILTELSALIPDSFPVRVVRMVADNETIRFKAVTGDFNTVDNVQKALQKSNYFKEVVIASANQAPQGDEVSFEMKLMLAGE